MQIVEESPETAVITVEGVNKRTHRFVRKTIIYRFGRRRLEALGTENIRKYIEKLVNDYWDEADLINKKNKDIKSYIANEFRKKMRQKGGDTDIKELEIVEKVNVVPKLFELFSLQPQNTGYTTVILGRSFTGKTTLLSKLLDRIPDAAYDKIVIFTESINAESILKIKNKHKDIIILPTFVKKVVRFFKELNDKCNNMFKFLLVFDDILELRNSVINKLFVILRNSNISTIVCSQYSKMLTPSVRSNVHNLIITGLRNEEWQSIIRGYSLKEFFGCKTKNLPLCADEAIKLTSDMNRVFYHNGKTDFSAIASI